MCVMYLKEVQVSCVLCMENEEAAEALEQLFSAEFREHDAVEPLMFVFTFMQDMYTFLACGR